MTPDVAERATFARRALLLVPLAASVIPPVLVGRAVVQYGVDLPYWDQWGFVGLLLDATDGRLRLAALWGQANEHRIVLPRLVMLGLARLTGWDVRAEMAVSFGLALLNLALLAGLIVRTVRPLAPSLVPWLVFAASCLVFSLSQAENWTWGIQLMMFMNVLATLVVAWSLVHRPGTWGGLATMTLGAIAGTLSFGAGLMLLVLLPFGVLLGQASGERGRRWPKVIVAAAVAGAAGAAYSIGFEYPSYHPSPTFALSHPLTYAHYVGAYVGAGLAAWSSVRAALWAIAGSSALAASTAWLWKRSPAYRRALAPWVFLALYAVLTGLMTGVGRAGFGPRQAVSGRYITISSLFWVSVVVVVGMALAELVAEGGAPRRYGLIALASLVLTLAARDYARSWTAGAAFIRHRHDVLVEARPCVLQTQRASDDCLGLVFPYPFAVRWLAALLESHRLGPFRNGR